jgi:hypothetical protein
MSFSFSPCGRRWPEGPDEGSHDLSTRVRRRVDVRMGRGDPSSGGFAATFSHKGRRNLD